jgi:hypothetical protein
MLTKDYKSRPFARDLLEHPWLKNAPNTAVSGDVMKHVLSNMSKFNATQKL